MLLPGGLMRGKGGVDPLHLGRVQCVNAPASIAVPKSDEFEGDDHALPQSPALGTPGAKLAETYAGIEAVWVAAIAKAGDKLLDPFVCQVRHWLAPRTTSPSSTDRKSVV